MDVYFTANAMERETAERLMELTRRAFPQAQWNCRQAEDEESDLRALILADDVPEIVVCAPGEANLWVSDGLFAALDGRVTDADRIDEQVLAHVCRMNRCSCCPLSRAIGRWRSIGG